MICTDCRAAGAYLTNGDQVAARGRHDECRGGTWCDCHHKLTSCLNLLRIKATMDDKDESPSI